MLYMSMQQLVEYDPNLKLSSAISDVTFEKQLLTIIKQSQPLSAKSAIHFTSEGCFCQFVAGNHIQNLSKQLAEQGFENLYIDVNKHPQLKAIIPSTPSIAIIGSQNELIYLGPYAEGYGCITGTSLVDKVVEKVLTNSVEHAVLVTEAKGCYCDS
ncbi:DUF6436 domain-containing protein [Paraglaciecola aquimarina]|uniref:DUF6436 domain-containing protein n=1 Tax=Paraglaciecola algarum TaxID=3050085 RepID=A0ABS9D5D6_9ALTE|nr:DUF6436 domain-containing protein [Paraglaciecola sp. G1-23]MCF2947640.1 DUF6436 domain-containing protein [Paraglaciecola sp. G1-23]